MYMVTGNKNTLEPLKSIACSNLDGLETFYYNSLHPVKKGQFFGSMYLIVSLLVSYLRSFLRQILAISPVGIFPGSLLDSCYLPPSYGLDSFSSSYLHGQLAA